nr:hypothetical protein [Tanacetum cinerariifolium]
MKCKPLYFKGTKGVIELTQWFERMKTVFCISKCTVENQIKFVTCTLLGSALTWWNSHVKTVSPDVAYAMTSTDLKKKMIDKYFSRGEIMKLKVELWNLKSEGSAIPTEPHHTPSPQEQQSLHYTPLSPSKPTTTTEPIPTATPTEIPTLRQYSRRATRIAQSKALSPAADEPASLLRDDSQGEAFPTVSSLDAGQNKENINKTFALPHESTPRVTSLDADEGNGDKSADKGSDNTDEMANVLGTLGAANILASGGLRLVFTTASLSVATARTCVSPDVATASPSKEKVLEQMSVQLARDLEAKFAQEDQIIREQAERDFEIAMIHSERELEMMIAELDRSNEMVAKYLSEYEQDEAGLSHDEKVALINELLMYQRNLAQIKKYQAQQNKPYATKISRIDGYLYQSPKGILTYGGKGLESRPRNLSAKGQELMDLCTGLQRQQTQMADKIKDQDLQISGLKERVKILEDKDRGSVKPSGDDAPIKGRKPKKKKLQEQIDAQVAKEMEEDIARENQWMNEQIARDAKIARIHAEEELKMLIDGLDRSNEVIAKHLQEYEQSEAELTIEEKIDLINELEKMKTSEDVFEEDLKGMMQLVPVEEVYVKALQVKHPIIDWEIHSKGKKDYWKIIRLGGHTTVYQVCTAGEDKDYSQSKTHLSQSKTYVSYSWNVSCD